MGNRKVKKDSYVVNVRENSKFAFCTDVLKLNSLHYGYWDQKEGLNLENVRKAQARYTDTLVDMVPSGVKKILDVGCGTGDVSFKLAEKEYSVTALSPDKNHKKFFENADGKIRFHNLKFEELDIDEDYDLVLMSESQNYFDTEVGFKQCNRYLKPGGYLLVSGMFRKGNSDFFKKARNIEKEYIEKAQKYNLTLAESIDITDNTLPTLEYAHQAYQEYIIPLLDVLTRYFEKSSRIKTKALKLVFSKEIKRFKQTQQYYEERLNPDLFLEYVKYLRLLFHYR